MLTKLIITNILKIIPDQRKVKAIIPHIYDIIPLYLTSLVKLHYFSYDVTSKMVLLHKVVTRTEIFSRNFSPSSLTLKLSPNNYLLIISRYE